MRTSCFHNKPNILIVFSSYLILPLYGSAVNSILTILLLFNFVLSFSFSNKVSKAASGTLPLTVQHLCYIWYIISCQWSPNPYQFSFHGGISRGGKDPNHMPHFTGFA